MRHITFIGILGLSAVCSLGCNDTPAEPSQPPRVATVIQPHRPEVLRSASPRRAVIIRNNGCGLFDGDGGFAFADRDFTLATQSSRLNTILVCKVKKVANSTGGTLRYDSEHNPFGSGVVCVLVRPEFFIVTAAWTETISASGNGTLRCRFKR